MNSLMDRSEDLLVSNSLKTFTTKGLPPALVITLSLIYYKLFYKYS